MSNRLPGIVWDDLRAPALALRTPASSNPTLVKVADNGSGSIGVWAYSYAHNAINYGMGALQLPHRYLAESPLRPHIHWQPGGADTGDVVWRLEYWVASALGTYPATSTVSTDLVVASTGDPLDHLVSSFGEISGAGLKESSMFMFTIARIGNDGADDCTDEATLLEFDLHFQVHKHGTGSEFPA